MQELLPIALAAILFLVGSIVLLIGTLIFRKSMQQFGKHNENLWRLHLDLVDWMEAASHLEAWRARKVMQGRKDRAIRNKHKDDKQDSRVRNDGAA